MNPRNKFLILYLILPLGLISVLFICLSIFLENDQILGNIASELIGIIVTILYVDFILQKHEIISWKAVSDEINKRLRRFSFNSIESIRDSLKLLFKDIWQTKLHYLQYMSLERRYFEIITASLVENILENVPKIDIQTWRAFIIKVEALDSENNKILEALNVKLTPKQYELCLMVQSISQKILLDNESIKNINLSGAEIDDSDLRKFQKTLENTSGELISLIGSLKQLGLTTFTT